MSVPLIEMVPANQEALVQQEVDLLGEGGETGELPTESSLVFAALEVCLCALVGQLPALSPSSTLPQRPSHGISDAVVASTLSALQLLPQLCSPQGNFGLNIMHKMLFQYDFLC